MSERIFTKSKGNFQTVEAFPSSLHSSILPLIHLINGEFRLLGTAFVLNHAMGMLVTAKHCLEEAYGNLHHRQDIPDKLGAFCVFYLKKDGEEFFGDLVEVKQAFAHEKFDFVILKSKVPVPKGSQNPEESFFRPLAVDFSLPEIGDRCLAMGYNADSSWKKLEETSA